MTRFMDEALIVSLLVQEIERLGCIVTFDPEEGLSTWPKDRPTSSRTKATLDQCDDIAELCTLVHEMAEEDLQEEEGLRAVIKDMGRHTDALKKIMACILGDEARMRALGVKDENELGQLPVGVLFAYGHGAGIDAPPIYPWSGETP
jgi:hypothetical protein